MDTIPYLLTTLQEQRQAIIDSMGPATDKGYDPANFNRLTQLGWAGSLNAFIYTTLVHGRPVSGLYWPSHESMPAWSQTAGGPLRNDQLQDLTAYILNFNKGDNWTLEDLFAVNQFAIIPGGGEPAIEQIAPTPPTEEQIVAIVNQLTTVTADPQNGQALYNSGRLACAGCHVTGGGVIAPHLEGTWTRVLEVRLADPRFAGYTGEQYLVESILRPDLYTVLPYAGVMPTDFGTRLDMQMLADIVAYLKSQDGPSPE